MADAAVDFDETFDVIIAGAGPAGCVLASRLSEESSRKILLIDAGPDTAPGTEHPDVLDPFAIAAGRHEAFHWPGLMAEQDADTGDGSARTMRPYLQARCIGGASNINGMGVDRGQPDEYDAWRDRGADTWSWNEVLPYFKKLEHDLDFPGPMHGDSGPMPVRRLPRPQWAPFPAAMADALERRGFPFLADYTADFRDGFSEVPTNALPDRRVSASMAYLTREVRGRPNLKILANARVDRVSIAGGRANGVFVHINGVTKLIQGRQIIVACGALFSPALLMRSGIGPAEHLTTHGIEVVRDAPGVGANLQNHPCISLVMYLPRKAAQQLDNPAFLQNWLRFSSHHPGCERNDMHLMHFNKGAWHKLGRRIGMASVTVLNAYSKGSVRLSSADPAANPQVRFNVLSDPRDSERLVAGLRFVLELLTDPAVKKMRRQVFIPNERLVASLSSRNVWNGFKARLITLLLDLPPLRSILLAKTRIDLEKLLGNETALREFVRKAAKVQFHVCGTCRMGRADDGDAVVDGAGRVHGIEGLRVADASIFPAVPRGYTHFIVLMAAEKIADAIKAQWAPVSRLPG